MLPYAEEMRGHLLPMLRSGRIKEEVARPAHYMVSRLTQRQRRQVDALSKERGYRPFQAWYLSR
jgi:hypothetical protein